MADVLNNTFHVYRSAAGSGKTRALAKTYLILALRFGGDYFKHILAVTFTNKSTQEMKERILQYLADFSDEKYNDLSRELCRELRFTEEQLSRRSTDLLSTILHNYSAFSISTIDSFFQRIIRSFSRESGFLGDFQLELDTDLVLDEVLKKMMDELDENEQLIKWVVEFARHRLMEGKSWDIERELSSFAKEIFKERFKIIESEIDKPLEKHSPHKEKLEALRKEVNLFENHMQKKAVVALNILRDQAIEESDFKYGGQGTVLKYFREFSKKRYYPSGGKRIQNALAGGVNWYKKGVSSHVLAITDEKLLPALQAMVQFDKQRSRAYFSSGVVLKHFYAYGLIADISQKLNEYRREHNLLLISDVSAFIYNILSDGDITFLYEKIGSYFFHYLIDEFQDTSSLQWKNFSPLLKEALDQGRSSFVVGDIKQSIYRWRGGDPNLLQHEVPRSMGNDRVKIDHLNVNYRSADIIVQFNNALFKKAADTVSDLIDSPIAKEAYDNVEQQTGFPVRNSGYVRIDFLPKQHEDGTFWQEAVLKKLPELVEELQDKGVRLEDIALLTRKKEEGQRIATTFLHYKNNYAKPGYRYDVISDESLQLDAAPSVKLLLSALRYIHVPNDAIARVELTYRATKIARSNTASQSPPIDFIDESLPDEILEKMKSISGLSIYEMVEELMTLFRLHEFQHEQAYLQSFQSVVLEFSCKKEHGLASFLTYWENTGGSHSVQTTGNIDAMQILTIHKAKGLQFKCVIIPFLNWKLDHEGGKSPLLWVKSTQAPFEKMGFLAVRYHKALEKSYFSEAYHRERAEIHLDNLNLLYVSLTRAESMLIAYAPKSDNVPEKPITVGELIYFCLAKNSDHTLFDGSTYCVGKMTLHKETTPLRKQQTLTSEKYVFYPWRERLLSLSKDRDYSFLCDRKKKAGYGIKVHELLASLHYKDEADRVLSQFCVQHMLGQEEQTKLHKMVQKMLTHPIVSTWFDRSWVVKTEIPILLPKHVSKRIDRMMTNAQQTVIVDYKTGEETDKDQDQVREYIGLMEQMGNPCSGYLLYLTSMKIVSIAQPHI